MIPAILEFARRASDDFRVEPGVVLEVGSYNVNGTIRDVFQASASSYTGVDITAGPGVDIVLDAHKLNEAFAPETFDTVLSCECLEHDTKPWITVAHLHALLKPGGYLFVTTPTFGFPLHRYPIDCYRFGEDAYRLILFEGIDILRLEEVLDSQGFPVICCFGRKPITQVQMSHDHKSGFYSIPENPEVGVVVGTHGSPGYVAMHLHILRMHNPEVPVLIVDDCSSQHEALWYWCEKYNARLIVNSARLGHARGDMGVFVQGLLWGKQLGLDLLIKLSRRFVPICAWVDDLRRLAYGTQHHTYSNPCTNTGFGFQTQAMGMHVDSHYAMLSEYFRGAESEPQLVEAFVHQQIAQKIPLAPAARAYENPHKGFATWNLVGNRLEKNYPAFWHQTHTKFEYYTLARLLGIDVGIEQF